jgi:tyrosinase
MRFPTSTNQDARSNSDEVEKSLQNNRSTIRNRVYNLMSRANTWAAFALNGFAGVGNNSLATYDSLESISGQIHGLTAKNGHFGVVDFAAFDPVFWLHACNVCLAYPITCAGTNRIVLG